MTKTVFSAVRRRGCAAVSLASYAQREVPSCRRSRPGLVLAAVAVLIQLPTLVGALPARASNHLTADLEIVSMTASRESVPVGEGYTYTIVVRNNGPDAAPRKSEHSGLRYQVRLSDQLPSGTTYKSSEVTPRLGVNFERSCSSTANVVVCNLDELDKGQELTIRITVSAVHPGRAVNSAVVFTESRNAIDPQPTNNQASAQTEITGLPDPTDDLPDPEPGEAVDENTIDLAVTIEDQPDPVEVNGQILYMVSVVNNGPARSRSVQVRAEVPTAAKVESWESTKGTCNGTNVGGSFRCRLPDGLMPGESAMFAVVVTAPDRDQTVAASVTVLGELSYVDPVPANNHASTTTEVTGGDLEPPPPPPIPQPPATTTDLAVTMTDNPDPVAVGKELMYKITVKNVGPVASAETVMSLRFRGGYAIYFRGSLTNQPGVGKCGEAFSTISCRVGALAPGESMDFSIFVHVEERALWAVATVDGHNDVNQTNNYAVETTNVSAGPGSSGQASLSLGMEDDPDPVKATRELTYTLNVRNDGPETANDVVVTDLLPAGVAFRSASSGCSFDDDSRTVTCRRANQGADTTSSWAIVVVPERAGTLSNAAQASSTTADPDPSDNQVSESTTVEPAADLSVAASTSSDTVEVGAETTYTMAVANQGPDAAQAVKVMATLPESLAYRSSSSGCSFDASSSTVTCALGRRDAGQSVSVDITAVPVKTGRITTVARLESATFDPDTSDNESAVMVEAGCPAIGLPGPGQVAYPSGWALVGLPEGTRVPADSKLYGWSNRNDEGDYSSQDSSEPVRAGHGYWARFACPRLVDVGAGSPSTAFPLGAHRSSMVGNPSGTEPVTVSGHDFAALWDPSLNEGAGGYRYSGYQQAIALAPGEGAWVFSYRNTEIRMQP